MLDPRQDTLIDDTVLVSDHLQSFANNLEEFAAFQQMIRIAGAAETLVSPREGLVDQDSTVIEMVDELGNKWTIQVVDDDDGGETSSFKRQRITGLQVRLDDLGSWITGEVYDRRDVAVQHRHRMTPIKQIAGMPAATGR